MRLGCLWCPDGGYVGHLGWDHAHLLLSNDLYLELFSHMYNRFDLRVKKALGLLEGIFVEILKGSQRLQSQSTLKPLMCLPSIGC